MPRLNDKTCIVTGAGCGIGAAIAREIGAEAMRLDLASGQDWRGIEQEIVALR
jgi:NADP-dependent 3-hydroxy acid dehydrogenase YdfG